MVISKSESSDYLTQISNGKAHIKSDVNHEKAEEQTLGPHELLCAGLASCMNITTRMVLDRMKIEYRGVTVKVDLDRQDDSTTFLYDINIDADISEDIKQEIIKKVERCPVKKTLSKEIKFNRI